ncbi:hypothetical protein Krac_1030 [Ktedonobacter racemifer DSM 44963]|uniref:Uncharacterized protein n=1 Tax=Ktedonobacter racemifer DSM 44963 TaxID=485913 RepID=D6U622_KTERA|nr:hypothetical protein Krac_1030 [Ktedonobacter racemifer DSM 44963]
MPVSSTQITNEDEKRVEPLQEGFEREANPSKGVSSWEDHRCGGPSSLPFEQRLSKRLAWSSVWATDPFAPRPRRAHRLPPLRRRRLGFLAGKISQLQQSHSRWRQQSQQAYDAFCTLQLAFLQTTSCFEAFLDHPVMLVPLDPFPGLSKGGGDCDTDLLCLCHSLLCARSDHLGAPQKLECRGLAALCIPALMETLQVHLI